MQLSSDPAERESRLRESAQFFASFLDDLGTLAKDRQQQKEAGYQDQSSFNILAETATDGIISIDDQSTITYANPAMGRMFGYEVAELLGKELTSLMPERFRAKHLTALGKYVTTGQRHLHWGRIELVDCTRTGRELPIEVSFGEAICDGRQFFTGIVRDVSERKRVEEALRASEQLQIMRCCATFAVAASCESQYPCENLAGLYGKMQMHPASIKSAVGKLTWRWVGSVGLAAGVGSVYFLVAYFSLTGMFFLPSEGITLFWAPAGISSGLLIALGGSPARWSVVVGVFVAAFAVPLVILQRGVWLAMIFALCDTAEPLIIAGLVARYFGADFALTQLRRVFVLLGATIAGTAPSSLAAACASRLFLGPAAPILTTWLHWWTGVAVGVVTVAPLIIGFSAAVREPPPRSEQIEGVGGLLALAAMTGVMITLPRKLWETVVPGALLFPILLWLAARCRPVFAAGGVLIVSVAVTWATNFGIGHLGNTGLPIDYRILQAQAILLVAAIGAQVLAALFAERRESEASLARSNALLERERDNKLLQAQAITAAIAHEIRQPLAGMAMNANVAMRYLAQTPLDHDEIRAALNRITRDVHRTNEVFDGIRALFGKCGQERQPIDLNRIVHGVIDSLQAELNGHDVVARHELATELPLVNGHRAQLQEVVFNLINNAVEAMSTMTDRSRVLRLRTEVRGRDEIAVSVQDSGPGIDPQQLHNVFNAFISTKEHGTGLGLAICRMIVEGHDGQLTASSDGKSGALFQFTLPIGPSAGEATAVRRVGSGPQSSSMSFNN